MSKNVIFPEPPIAHQTHFVSMLGRYKGPGSLHAVQLHRDGHMAFEEVDSQAPLRPHGFKTGSGGNSGGMFAPAHELRLAPDRVPEYVYALLTVLNICGLKVPESGHLNLQDATEDLLVLREFDILVLKIKPSGRPEVPVGSRIEFRNSDGQVRIDCPRVAGGQNKTSYTVRSPFGADIAPGIGLLWQRQVLDALAVGGVFVGPTFEHDLAVTSCRVKEYSPLISRLALERS